MLLPSLPRITVWVQILKKRTFLGHPRPQLYLPLLLHYSLFSFLPLKGEDLVLPFLLLGAIIVQGAGALQD